MRFLNIKINSLILIGYLLLANLFEVLQSKFPIFSFYDELFAIIFIFVVLIKGTKKKELTNIFLLSFLLLSIGVLSNFYADVQVGKIPIILDMLRIFKLTISCLGFYCLLDSRTVSDIVVVLQWPAKIYIILGLCFGICSLFINLGMRGEKRFGFWAFNFIYKNTHVYIMAIILCLILIALNKKTSDKKIFLYSFLVFLQMILSTKGTSFAAGAAAVIVFYFAWRNKKINIKTIALIVVAGLLVGTYQINTYFSNHTAPRYRLIEGGVRTALRFFPFGGGFGSYGSDIAAKYNSTLQSLYGFDRTWGMRNGELMFLNDNYWPMILGEFGFIGFFLVLLQVIILFKLIVKSQAPKYVRAVLLSAYIYILIASLGTCIFSTSITILVIDVILMGIVKYNK